MLFPTLLIGQILDPEVYSYDCIEEENNAFVDTTYRGIYDSRNGCYHSPHGKQFGQRPLTVVCCPLTKNVS